MSRTNLSEIRLAIAELIQNKTELLTLIEVNESYVFDYIDPPAVMEEKHEPKRAIISIIGMVIGSILSIIFVFLRNSLLAERI